MSEQQEAPGALARSRGPKNQMGGGFDAMLQRDQDAWIQYAHDHIHEILADALKWQAVVEQELDELDWMRDDPLGWYMDTFAEARIEARKLIPAIAAMKSARAVRDARAKPQRIHQLRATNGWPPIAVPGQPGRYLASREAA